ncbi:hypothetical protein PCL_12590 [Purpureocillium lilacinum]|uniref:CFEM domain-containing protein n=1 Tax=Purpureocillium lilacinum TaxID=33203 RepID=A0A2U3E9Q3_PURLI|nr:hypothetical protein PCL_12590 [Purpureocillium lilacinum]
MKPQTSSLLALIPGAMASRGILYEPTVAKVLDHMPDCGWSCWAPGVAATSCAAANNITCLCGSIGKMGSGMEGCAEERCDKTNWCKLAADVSITLGVMCYRLSELPANSTQKAEASAAVSAHLAQYMKDPVLLGDVVGIVSHAGLDKPASNLAENVAGAPSYRSRAKSSRMNRIVARICNKSATQVPSIRSRHCHRGCVEIKTASPAQRRESHSATPWLNTHPALSLCCRLRLLPYPVMCLRSDRLVDGMASGAATSRAREDRQLAQRGGGRGTFGSRRLRDLGMADDVSLAPGQDRERARRRYSGCRGRGIDEEEEEEEEGMT